MPENKRHNSRIITIGCRSPTSAAGAGLELGASDSRPAFSLPVGFGPRNECPGVCRADRAARTHPAPLAHQFNARFPTAQKKTARPCGYAAKIRRIRSNGSCWEKGVSRACSALALGDPGQPEIMVPQPYSPEISKLYRVSPDFSKPASSDSRDLHRNLLLPACSFFSQKQAAA